MTKHELSNAVEQIIALSLAVSVDAQDQPIVGPMIRHRAQKVTAQIMALIERAGE